MPVARSAWRRCVFCSTCNRSVRVRFHALCSCVLNFERPASSSLHSFRHSVVRSSLVLCLHRRCGLLLHQVQWNHCPNVYPFWPEMNTDYFTVSFTRLAQDLFRPMWTHECKRIASVSESCSPGLNEVVFLHPFSLQLRCVSHT